MSTTYQYCPVEPSIDIFPLKLNLSHLNSDLDVVKNRFYAGMQLCKYASKVYMQVCNYTGMDVCNYAHMQVCKYSIKSEN